MNRTRDIVVLVYVHIGPMGKRGGPAPVSACWAGLTGWLGLFVQICSNREGEG